MWDGNARVTNWAGVMKMNFWVNLIQEHWASTSPINLVLHFMGNVQGGSIIHRVPLKNINLTKCRLINLFPNIGICAHCGICIACQKVRWSSNGILLPKLFWHTVRKKCSSDREKNLKFEAEGREFEKILRSLEQFDQTVKCQNNFW